MNNLFTQDITKQKITKQKATVEISFWDLFDQCTFCNSIVQKTSTNVKLTFLLWLDTSNHQFAFVLYLYTCILIRSDWATCSTSCAVWSAARRPGSRPGAPTPPSDSVSWSSPPLLCYFCGCRSWARNYLFSQGMMQHFYGKCWFKLHKYLPLDKLYLVF